MSGEETMHGLPRIRFADKLPDRADIVIIGGGAAGIATAYAMARLGYSESHRVVVLERGYLGRGSATRNAGRFRIHFFSKENARFALESRKRILELPHVTGVNPVITLGGYLWLFQREETLEAFRRTNEEIWRPLGAPVEFMSVEEVRERFPLLNPEGYAGAAFGPQNGSVHHDYMIIGEATYAASKGVIIAPFTEAEEIVVEASRVKGVRVKGHGTIEADKVLVAAGIWTKTLLERMRIELPLKPVRKSLFVTEPYKFTLKPFVTEFETGSYVCQTPKGEIIATMKYAPGEPETMDFGSVSLRWIAATARFVKKLVPWARLDLMRVWSGHYNVSPDHSHILGRDPEWPQGLYVATGFSGHGLMMSPYAGELVAINMVEDKVHPDMEPYLPTRFREGRLIHEGLVIG
ncbi:FAD-binding oxidoreductase [Pyrofollis japonicus]|uniref:NAD(P)/FAD-dependent oxidoreductase n=1 Tax=Pyrofollis japonicus TaxID=3060460 RepID=UPI00295BB0F5|nr:FAD-binding oxidoreductase [Pyrofollis japonicus]BEP17373.1 FAD-binding oxidoreductase [Pyrofollis japonicus]